MVVENPESPWLAVVGGAGQQTIPIPAVGEALPVHDDWAGDWARMNFWDAAYRGGPDFKSATDSEGNSILHKHERESDEAFARRKLLSVYANHCRPIVKKMVDYVFRQVPRRDQSNPDFNAWRENVDLRSTYLHPFLRSCMLRASVLGRYLIEVSSNRSADAGEMTEAQARAAGIQMLLRKVDPRRVINWQREGGVLTEALIVLGSGGEAVLLTEHQRTDFTMDEDGKVESVVTREHGWGRLPLIEMAPHDGESQIADIAELNRDAFNLGSLLREELVGATFTQTWITGVNATALTDESGESVSSGPNRVICLNAKDAKIETTGGDPAQAESLRKTIEQTETALYRAAGLKAEDPMTVSAPQSGIALRVAFDTLSATLSGIGEEAQRVESEITKLWNIHHGGSVAPPDWPETFGEPDTEAELERSLAVLETPALVARTKFLESNRINSILYPKASLTDQAILAAEVRERYGPDAPSDEGLEKMATMLTTDDGEEDAQGDGPDPDKGDSDGG